ncbi:MAG: cache domain-containing protein [bacterium]
MTGRFKLTAGFIAVILATNGLLSFVAVNLVENVVVEEVQDRVRLDLNSAREAYNGQLEKIVSFLRAAAVHWQERYVREDDSLGEIVGLLEWLRSESGTDLLTLLDAEGRVVYRVHCPENKGDDLSAHPFVSHALRTRQPVSGTVIVPATMLEAEGKRLVERARIKITPNDALHPDSESVETSGMMMAVAVPVQTLDGHTLGFLLGANLLNRRHEIVDAIKAEVFQNLTFEGKDIGTATIFQGDLRISTNVMNEYGTRAIGTRMSREVSRQVLEQGNVWADRAFVVNDWYRTAYEPIRDPDGRIIGALYVGLLEKPFRRPLALIVKIFLVMVLLTTAASFLVVMFVSRLVLRPSEQVVRMCRRVIDGDLSARVGIHPSGELGLLCQAIDHMAVAIAERENQLKQSTRRQIDKSEKLASVGRLAAGIAHEINNPLTGVLTFAYLLKERESMAEQDQQDLDVIIRETTRVREIVRGLLDYARESPSESQFLDLNDVIRKTINLISNQKEFKRIRITAHLSPKLPELLGDKNKLQQVMLNFMLNASQAMPDGGDITIETDMQNSSVVLRVSDTGCGIPPEDIGKIFDPFFTTRRVGEGTGLGLSVSLGIIEDHGGAIEVQSELSRNTTFTVTLPAPQNSPGE